MIIIQMEKRNIQHGSSNDTKYSNNLPSYTEILTQITSSNNIAVEWSTNTIFAIRITAMRNDKSGEKVMVYSDGTPIQREKINAPIAPIYTKDLNTGIKLESTNQLPANTEVVAEKIEYGRVFEKVSQTLSPEVGKFVIYQISLETNGVEIQPDGKVKISIPIPEEFNSTNVTVYHIADDGSKEEFEVIKTVVDGIEYATFKTEHFSTYVLTENSENGKDNTPNTGKTNNTPYIAISLTILSTLGIVVLKKK